MGQVQEGLGDDEAEEEWNKRLDDEVGLDELEERLHEREVRSEAGVE